MESILEYLIWVEDRRQEKKMMHKMADIIVIVFFATIANANAWMELYYFAVEHETLLRKYVELPNGIPSHDTIQRVFAMVSPEILQGLQTRWNEMLSSDRREIPMWEQDGEAKGEPHCQCSR